MSWKLILILREERAPKKHHSLVEILQNVHENDFVGLFFF